ncbi:MAG: hypothetical protein PHT50_02485 [Candidatus Omnitrophica bacterium]|nr:hypothetical protein [Candidatus Omnitrophota bacterium]
MGYSVLGLKKLKRDEIAQSMIEIAFVFAGIVLLFAAIMQIWFWANKQIVQRQQSYNAGRVIAGTSSDTYTLQWPVHKPEELTEDKVLRGE